MDSPKRDQALKEEIICPLCFCVFDNPLSLQCLHSYCEECLYSLHKSKGFSDNLDCPECRGVTVLGEEGIHGLTMNFKLKRIVEIMSTEEKREIAKQSVRKPPKPRPRLKPPLPEKPTPSCSQHMDKQLDLYCSQCKVLICSQCMLESHRFHKEPISAEEALQDKITSLKSSIPHAESLLTKAGAAVDKLQSDVDAIWRSSDTDVQEAQEYFQKLHHLLEKRELEVCKSIEARAGRHRSRIEKQKKVITTSIQDTQKTKASIKEIIEHRSSDTRVLIDEWNVSQKLDSQVQHLTLLIEKAKDKPRTSYKSTFTPDPDFEAQCKVVGIQVEPSTPTIQPRHTFVSSPIVRPRRNDLKTSESNQDLSKSTNGSPNLGVPLRTEHLNTIGSRPTKALSGSDFKPPLEVREVDGVIIQTPSVVINSSNILGPTKQKTISASPSGVCVGNSNTLVVADSKNHMFSILTPTGKFLHSQQGEGKGDGQFVEPTAVMFDIRGRILVLDKGQPPRVQLFTDSGNFVSKFKVRSLAFNCYLGEPLGIVAIDYKTVLVSDSEKSCVHIFDDEGKYQGKFGDTEMKTRQPAGMALDTRGNVFIADRGNHCVWIYTCGGQYVSKFGKHGSGPGELNYPYGVAIDVNGNIYISESVNHRISVFTPGGKFVRCFGKKGSEPGMFNGPRHLCMDSKERLVVADEQNQRVQIFDIGDY